MRKLKPYFLLLMVLFVALGILTAHADEIINTCVAPSTTLHKYSAISESAIANALGWVQDPTNRCNGYYVDEPFTYPQSLVKNNAIQIASDQPFIFSQHGTSVFQGKVTVTRVGQQMSACKAYIFRNPASGKISVIDLQGDVHLREPSSLVIGQRGHLDKDNQAQSLTDIIYRTAIFNNFTLTHMTTTAISIPATALTNAELQKPRKILQLSAWGQAKYFLQQHPKIYELEQVTYTTCPPESNTWRVKAKHITLNKITGRGTATHTRLYIKGIPVFYSPYLSFPIDTRRQSGFLAPTVGSLNHFTSFALPFYWNIAPNYDDIITPVYIDKHGMLINNLFRYLTPFSQGQLKTSFIPHDSQFNVFKETAMNEYGDSLDPYTQSNLRVLENASNIRGAFSWQDATRYNANWSSLVDWNYVSDNQYLIDFKPNLNQFTTNQLLQHVEFNYQDPYWNFTGRVQGFQTVHPIGEIKYLNQYGSFPQFLLSGNFPDEKHNLEYFLGSELTHFDIRNNPSILTKQPIGNRSNLQPGIMWRFYRPYLFFTPRLQVALTQYNIGHVDNNTDFKSPNRTLPIFDINSGLNFDRDINLFGCALRQTLEPQMYYTYIPYRNQNTIPIFDTTLNTLTYDQLFVYNRFSGIDRIGDANQMSVGITTRFISRETGYEKIKAAIGQIYYFRERKVTLCYGSDCHDVTIDPDNNNKRNRSPVSATVTYQLNAMWNLKSDTIWNSFTRRIDNQSFLLHYQPDPDRVINVGYNYVRNNVFLMDNPNDNSVHQTDVSVGWPINRDFKTVFRWSQDWSQGHFQNLLYGIQYDSCCWAVRFIAGRAYVGTLANNTAVYDPQYFLQFALKGLGNIGYHGDPSQMLASTISGYQNYFGRDF